MTKLEFKCFIKTGAEQVKDSALGSPLLVGQCSVPQHHLPERSEQRPSSRSEGDRRSGKLRRVRATEHPADTVDSWVRRLSACIGAARPEGCVRCSLCAELLRHDAAVCRNHWYLYSIFIMYDWTDCCIIKLPETQLPGY
ncbi:hypothetical protein AOLI_G00265500 [Acnodon oligacanthus]